MRRVILPVLMISILLLSACGNGGAAEEKLEKQRDTLAAAERVAFTAEVTASLGDEVFLCTLDCAATPEEITVEVVEPSPVAGVKATVKNGEATLRYADVQLSVGTGLEDSPGPLGAMPLLFRALRVGHVIRAWTEKDGEASLIAAEIYADDDLALTMWFDAGTLSPVHASVSRDGAEVIRCAIRNFTFH